MAFDPISAIMDVGGKLIDKLIPDPKAKAEALQKLQELQQAGDLQVIADQVSINKIEAASTNMFIAGWRPWVGWVSGSGLAFQFVLSPFIEWGMALAGHPTKLPTLDNSLLTTLLVGLLGLGGMRTLEKLQGVEGNR